MPASGTAALMGEPGSGARVWLDGRSAAAAGAWLDAGDAGATEVTVVADGGARGATGVVIGAGNIGATGATDALGAPPGPVGQAIQAAGRASRPSIANPNAVPRDLRAERGGGFAALDAACGEPSRLGASNRRVGSSCGFTTVRMCPSGPSAQRTSLALAVSSSAWQSVWVG
jgi:hypothetical protein